MFHYFARCRQTKILTPKCASRADGFLMRLSPMAGINYLDKNFHRHLSEPIDALFDNDDASAQTKALRLGIIRLSSGS